MPHTEIVDLPEVEVALYLIGDFQPERVASAFDVAAKVAVAKGSERRRKSTGEVLGIYQEATWGFTSGDAVRSNEIADHVAWLVSKGAAARGFIGQDVHAFLEVSLQTGTSCVLPESLLSFAGELRAEIGIVARMPHAA
jgi:hypothetical protein